MTPRWAVAALLTVSIVLGACSFFVQDKQYIQIDVKRAHAAYADVRQVYAQVYMAVAEACVSKRLLPVDCDRAKAIHQRVMILDSEISRSLLTPGVEPNWSHIKEITELLIELMIL